MRQKTKTRYSQNFKYHCSILVEDCFLNRDKVKFMGTEVGSEVVLRSSTIGNDTTFLGNAYVYHSKIGKGCVIGNNVEIIDCLIGDYCTITEETDLCLKVPSGSYVESTKEFGSGHDIVSIYTPKGLYIKPGCLAIEPAEKTLKRLENPDRIVQWSYFHSDDRVRFAKEITEYLQTAMTYTV